MLRCIRYPLAKMTHRWSVSTDMPHLTKYLYPHSQRFRLTRPYRPWAHTGLSLSLSLSLSLRRNHAHSLP